jgi:hypothetical protein
MRSARWWWAVGASAAVVGAGAIVALAPITPARRAAVLARPLARYRRGVHDRDHRPGRSAPARWPEDNAGDFAGVRLLELA